MKVIEQYYGPVRRDPYHDINALRPMTATEMSYYGDQREVYIRVEVNRRMVHVKNYVPSCVPSHVALREAQRSIMMEVGREVFGG